MASGLGFGTTGTFGTSSYAFQIKKISRDGVEVGDVNTSHMGTTGGKFTFIAAALADGGTLTIDFHFDPAVTITVGGTVETFTVNWGGLGTSEVVNVYVKSFTHSATHDGEGLMEGQVVLKDAGATQS